MPEMNAEPEALAPCPCGQVPSRLIVQCEYRAKYAYVGGDCCDEWQIEFRNNYEPPGSAASIALARAAWTKAPRRQEGAEMEQLHAKGRKAWADVPDASKWVDELRGGDDLPDR